MSSAYYKGLLRGAKNDLLDYKKRKSQLGIICNNYFGFNSYATDLNDHCTAASVNSNSGIVISGGSNDTSSVWGKKDCGSSDSDLSLSKGYIDSEMKRVQDRIDELEKNINIYEAAIVEEERKEREAAERARRRAQEEREAAERARFRIC